MVPLLGLTTSLPNMHPLVVHFPIALAMFALALRVAHMVRPRWHQAATAATISTVGAALGGVVTWWAGREAVESLGPLAAAADLTLSRHANLAGWTVLALLAAAVIALLATWRQRERASNQQVVWRGGLFLSLIVVAGLLAVTADLGGRLVYVHGVAVAPLSRSPAGPTAGTGAHLVTAENIKEVSLGPTGLVIETHGQGMVTLPNIYSDVTVRVTLNPGKFHGEVALVHHAASLQDWEGMVLAEDGTVMLVRVTAGRRSVLKKTSLLFPREDVELLVAAAQGHFKGFVDDDLLLHGHGSSGPPGRVAVYYDGEGPLQIKKLAAEAASAQEEHAAEHGE